MYHRIAALDSDPWRLAVEPARFAEQLEVIGASFRPFSLGELVRAIDAGQIPSRAVTVTFDDGYRDNLYAAKPLLERYRIPATVFVVTGYLDSARDFWWDELARLCHGLEYRALHGRLQGLGHDERQALLVSMAAQAGLAPRGTPQTASTAEIVALAEGGLIEIGAHSVTHPAFPYLDRSDQLEEMRSSKARLEEALGLPVEGFSYPYGAHGPVTVDCARKAGFAYACTSVRDVVSVGSDPLALPRVHVDNWSGEELELKLSAWLS